MKRTLPLVLLLILFLSVSIFSGWRLYQLSREYNEGDEIYDNAAQFVTLPSPTPTPDSDEQPSDEEDIPDEEDDIDWPEVDFRQLQSVNPDVVGWIYLPDSKINYPIVLGEDNSYYLYRLYDRSSNRSGSIFMDFRNSADFSNPNTILYGHHMNNGSMFAGITKYKKQEYYNEHPYCLLLTPEGNHKVEFFAGYVARVDKDLSPWDLYFESAEEFDGWLKQSIAKSTFQTDVEVSPTDRVLTLSTCSYEYSNARYVLVGVIR